MASMLKSVALGAALLAGAAFAAQAQSVSSLPPDSGVAPQTTHSGPVAASTQGFLPKPGGNSQWQEQHYAPLQTYAADKAQHPYSTSIGPKPGSHSSGVDQPYQASEWNNQPAQRPYTAGGVGPKPN